jgi:hypothetical protein
MIGRNGTPVLVETAATGMDKEIAAIYARVLEIEVDVQAAQASPGGARLGPPLPSPLGTARGPAVTIRRAARCARRH